MLALVINSLSPSASCSNVAGQVHEIASLGDFGTVVLDVTFNPDGRLLSCAGSDGTIRLWDIAECRFLASVEGHRDRVRETVFHPDGTLLASASDDGTVRLWNIDSYEEITLLKGDNDWVNGVDFSPDGTLVASAGALGTICIWELARQKQITVLRERRGWVQSIAFSPDGTLLATGGLHGTVGFWNVAERRKLGALETYGGFIQRIAFSPDGTMLAAAGGRGTISLCDIDSRKEITVLKGHMGTVNGVAFSPDGMLLATAGDDHTVRVWTVNGWKETATLPAHHRRATSVAFSPDGKVLASGSADSTVILWDISGLGREITPPKPKYNPVLETAARFQEPSGNNVLEEGETATIDIVVINTGRGEAYSLCPKVVLQEPDLCPGVQLSTAQPVKCLNPGDSTHLSIGLSADQYVEDRTVELIINIIEANGFDSDPVVLKFPTRATKPPKLMITEWTIDDDSYGESQGNANLRFEIGEIAEVTLRITNNGEGEARSAKLDLRMPADPNLFYQSSSTQFEIGDLSPGGSKDITFAISTNKRYTSDHIELTAVFSDARPRFNSTEKFILPLEQETRPLVPIEIVPVIAEKGKVEVLSPLTSEIDIDIPETSMHNPDAIAVVIGNVHYEDRDIPAVEFAGRDATIVKAYLISTLGYDENNILYYLDADLGDFNRLFGREGRPRGRLYDYLKPDQSDVFVYYSGHGAPDPEAKHAYILPSDCDPEDIEQTGYSRNTLFENLAQLPARSVTVVIDACFSGISDAGSLLGDISPIYIETDPAMEIPNGVVFSSSKGDQISTWYREQKHGLFTYFFLKGLRGDADSNSDGKITVRELETYLTDPADGVPYWARRLKSREQTPVVVAKDRDKVVVELR